ncbi:Glucan 1,3-beta-glucosidase [Paramyrothecium foliicola]|nr:Glucan 1,3-beta-glucosidase [Paramyrothecium foliicola]
MHICVNGLLLTALALAASAAQPDFSSIPGLPVGPPQPAPTYMKDNTNNQFGVAPDKGTLGEPVLKPRPSNGAAMRLMQADNTDDYWLSSLGPLGRSSFGPSGYQFFRNVKDFGAVGDGRTDDTAAIERAVGAMSPTNLKTRCGKDCGSNTALGAVVYFPPGTYVVKRPIIQYFHTQFVGNPKNKAVIKGHQNFTGIALVDANPYIPQGNGRTWFVNQSNFFRQVRNLVFDMRGMAKKNWDGDQQYVPTGIHWTVGQATSISNCDFIMDVSDAVGAATSVGIMMENGSGGSVSDLTFFGGNIGFLAGSQQFTATNLKFTSCLTAIKHEWNWGFVWKNIVVNSCWVAIDCTAYSESTKPPQGTGSISVIDSQFIGVPYAIPLKKQGSQQPNIIIDNLRVENVESVVLISGGDTLLRGSGPATTIRSWASGFQITPSDDRGGKKTGPLNPLPAKPNSLIDGNGAFYYRSKPQYETVAASSIIVATRNGILNDGTGDQTAVINSLLSKNVGRVIFFPGGTYLVKGTVEIPVGSKIIGSGWSSIMGTGSYFGNQFEPKPLIRVGKPGQSGVIEITDMLFTTKGATPGCIVMEWNVRESSKGSAAMWDSHFRIGGGAGTDLLLKDCPARAASVNDKCMAASMLLHLTKRSSGFFDNVWVWVADHDLEDPLNSLAYNGEDGIPTNVKVEISIYVGRGVLIEASGPTWFWGSASELFNATEIFFGHMQTETPYYQPNPTADKPYQIGLWASDPTFEDCSEVLEDWPEDATPEEKQGLTDLTSYNKCKKAWALRVIYSTDVFIYSAGFYSFFENNGLGCAPEEDCQTGMIETENSGPIWMFNVFTKGNEEIIRALPGRNGRGAPTVRFTEELRGGYTSEMAAWLVQSQLKRTLVPADGGPWQIEDSTVDWEAIDAENAQICFVTKPHQNTMNEQCAVVCREQIALAKAEGRTTNYGCLGWWPLNETIPWERVPGTNYQRAPGRCLCDEPLSNYLADTVIEALPVMAQIGCYIMMSALKLVIDIGLEITGAGRVLSTAEEAALTAVQIINYVYPESEDPAGAFEWWLHPCGGSNLVPEEIRRGFDILSAITDIPGNFRPPPKLKRGSGKKGDAGNPTDRSAPGPGGPSNNNPGKKCNVRKPTQRLPGGRNNVKKTMRIRSCSGAATVTQDTIIHSLTYAAAATVMPVTITCNQSYTHPCHHYRSAMSVNPQWSTLTCPNRAATTSIERLDGKATDMWSTQHPIVTSSTREGVATTLTYAWRQPTNRATPLCDADEFPPAYFLTPNDVAFVNGGINRNGQLVRYAPAGENRGAGGLWRGMCFSSVVVNWQDADYTRSASRPVATRTDRINPSHTITYMAVTAAQRPAMTMAFPGNKLPNDGHNANPCWPSRIAAADPGFALLTFDPYYQGQPPPYNYRLNYTQGVNGS